METMIEQNFTPGSNVFAKIDGKEVGPIYLVQIVGDKATLQGSETHVVPLSSLLASPSKAKEGV